MLTYEEVVWLFRCILGRVPDRETVEAFLKVHDNFGGLRDSLFYSEEFFLFMKDRLSDFRPTYNACDYPLRPYHPSLKRSTLALVCIVKNEEAKIGRMISSCLPLVDFVAVLDTGSVDKTVSAARSAVDATVPAAIETSGFVDFASARNQALDLALGKTDWVLMLDADEYLVLEDYASIAYLISIDSGIDGWRLPRFNFLEKTGLEKPYLYPDYQKRLFENRPDIRYAGRVHEWLTGIKKWGFAPTSEMLSGGSCGGPHIHHSALVSPDPLRAQAKYNLYQSLWRGE